MKRSEIFFTTILLPLDALALLGAFVLAYHIRDELLIALPSNLSSLAVRLNYTSTELMLSFSDYMHYLWYIIPFMILIFSLVGLYQIRQDFNWWQRLGKITLGVSMGEFFILVLFLLKKNFFLPRSTVVYSWILAILLVGAIHFLIRIFQKILYSYDIGTVKLFMVGRGQKTENILNKLVSGKHAQYRLMGRIDNLDDEIYSKMKGLKIDEIIISDGHYSVEDLVELRNYTQENHIGFIYAPPLQTPKSQAFEIKEVGNYTLIEVHPTPLEGWGRVMKRIFDILATSIIIILLSPVYLLVALGIKITTPGPLIYKHKRIGKNKKDIYVWKFRSMRYEFCTGHGNADANFKKLLEENPDLAQEWTENFKLKKDPRVTKFGEFIRKTSLDELPQLFNVLSGMLSLVGPRPIIRDEVEKYGDKARLLFTIKPGVTGLWQVSGRNDVTYDERVELDMSYVEHWSLWLDIKILFGTIWSLFKKGAY